MDTYSYPAYIYLGKRGLVGTSIKVMKIPESVMIPKDPRLKFKYRDIILIITEEERKSYRKIVEKEKKREFIQKIKEELPQRFGFYFGAIASYE